MHQSHTLSESQLIWFGWYRDSFLCSTCLLLFSTWSGGSGHRTITLHMIVILKCHVKQNNCFSWLLAVKGLYLMTENIRCSPERCLKKERLALKTQWGLFLTKVTSGWHCSDIYIYVYTCEHTDGTHVSKAKRHIHIGRMHTHSLI